ncbi:hypothetical protein V1264_024144 [Littorina saxatilis]|uniref:Fibronectin type-III domain-containing protein n=1 Tax=Littorina saxatilis TaxID=31220 RepID=A0AAN9B9T1_9CAEN
MFSVRGQHSGVWGHLSSHLSSHLLLAVVLCQALHVGGWPVPTPGRIEEDASYNHMYYVGENLTVQCIKFSNFTGDVYFQQGNVNYSPEYVTQINTTHALLDKPVTDDDFEETILTCADGDGTVATAYIYTDYAPREATDLKMVWLNEQFLLINWAFNNTSYKNGHDNRLIQVTGEWSYNASNANGWYICYSGGLNNAACNVTDITDEWVTVHVRVNITNVKRKDPVSTLFPGLPIRDHVKPLPAQQVNVVALNSTTARVSVTADRYRLVFHIKYFTMLGDNYINNTLVTSKTSEKSFDIPGLHPDYTYHFEVRCKIDIDRGYLSDLPQSIPEVRMPEDGRL